MDLLTPAYKKLVQVARDEGRGPQVMSERVMELIGPLLLEARSGNDPVITLDMAGTAIQAFALNQVAEVEKKHAELLGNKDHTMLEAREGVFIFKMLAQWAILHDAQQKREPPFCCTAHLTRHMFANFLEHLAPTSAINLLTDLLAHSLMLGVGKDMARIDQVVRNINTTLCHKCYEIAYGESGAEGAREAEARK